MVIGEGVPLWMVVSETHRSQKQRNSENPIFSAK
ncbi:MAG: hypothetical protein RLZZ597_1644 [Cyanobacteriota bacterium]|jgi:hypothetical protein